MSLLQDISRLLGGKDRQARGRVQEDLLTSLLVMAWMVEARDPYTGGHLWRVSRFSRLLATDAGLPEADAARIAIGGFLHDLGKISVPDHILGKKERLSEQEYDVIKTHPEVGWRLLAEHPLAGLAEAAVRAHHETPDGNGYPRGLAGLDVPLDARIVGICDAFDAMTSTRPYRRGMPVAKALEVIEDNLARQFDRDFGQRFVALGRTGGLDHVVGHSDLGIPLHDCAMCGAALVLKRGQAGGEHVYCRSCAGEYLTEMRDGQAVPVATGAMGAASDLEPEADTALIAGFVRESARALLAA
ncbi:MAG TPA: HD-GYP domain-containing protein [Rhodocyclaceae bacterium]|nr:HD-GYP domain-containing protein [Rhodocyclaceae bacterium]